MAVAALVERKRQNFVQKNTTSDSMSVFWLVPQFLIVEIGDGFVLVGLQEYFYDQVPDSMRSLGFALYLSVNGAANFLSSVLITVVDRLTEKSGRSWFGKDLNSSRLDYFYWLLGAITAANLCVYVFVARNYTYKRTMPMTDCDDADDGGCHAMKLRDQPENAHRVQGCVFLDKILSLSFHQSRDNHGGDGEYHPDSLEDGEPSLVPYRSSQYGHEDSIVTKTIIPMAPSA
nr:protein NRT1/ PTR FAMILY 5.6-like [Ipomoea batatas]